MCRKLSDTSAKVAKAAPLVGIWLTKEAQLWTTDSSRSTNVALLPMPDARLLRLVGPQALFRTLIDHSPIMLWVGDHEGKCVFASQAWLAFTGRALVQELGHGWAESVHVDDRAAILRQYREALASRQPFSLEYRLRRADGAFRWVCDQGHPWVAPDGAFLGHVGTCVDITDRKESDLAGLEEPRRLKRLIEKSHDMVYRTRLFPTRAVEYTGGAVQAITGHTPSEFYADPDLPRKAVHEDDRPLIVQTLRDPAHLQTTIILRWLHPDGRVVWAEHRRVPVYDASGQLVAIEGIARDVTEYVESERRLRESEEQLRLLAGRLQTAREEERGRVARELHDELGQTLTALKLDISRTVQALNAERLTPSMVDRIQSLVGLSDIALATVKRIATNLRPPTLDHLGLAEAIHWEALTFKARTGLRCQVRTNKERTNLSSEQQTSLFRIFQEALTNIVRHAQASAVQVTLTERDDRFELRIRDNGRGITSDEAADPHAIGLLGMRERAGLVGGKFNVSGRRGKGTVVSVFVPIAHKTETVRQRRNQEAERSSQ